MIVGFTSLSKNSVIPKPVMRKICYSFKSNSPEVKLNRGYLVSSSVITIVS